VSGAPITGIVAISKLEWVDRIGDRRVPLDNLATKLVQAGMPSPRATAIAADVFRLDTDAVPGINGRGELESVHRSPECWST
jgi:hypothetical protein